MSEKMYYKVGQRVQYLSGGKWKPFGEIIEEDPPLKMNGAILVGPKYRVKWDEGFESGWLSYHELRKADD